MSLISLATVGLDRDRASTATPGPAGFGRLVVAQIPSEALLAYAAILAVFGTASSSFLTGRWILYGVTVAVCPIVVITTYLAKRTYRFVEPEPTRPAPSVVTNPLDIVSPADDAQVDAKPDPRGRTHPHLPILPALAGAAAMAVFGLTIPGSALQYATSNDAFGVTAICLAVAGAVMMAIVAPFLGRANRATIAETGELQLR